jgi:hypothetical protein
VDVPVTVNAAAAGHLIYPCGSIRDFLISRPRDREIGGVEGNVAIPAQSDRRFFQQGGIGAAVGLMAIEAIFQDGRVLKNERTAVLSVTVEAKFPGGNSLDELGRSSSVRVVAAGAIHFSLAHGMMREFVLGADLLFMTGRAGIRDGYTGELIPVGDARSRMDRVAIGAGDAFVGVNAAGPEESIPLLMAFETDIIALGNRRCRPPRKAAHPHEGFAA